MGVKDRALKLQVVELSYTPRPVHCFGDIECLFDICMFVHYHSVTSIGLLYYSIKKNIVTIIYIVYVCTFLKCTMAVKGLVSTMSNQDEAC